MERTMWTDERLDDLARRMDAGFERMDREIRDLRLVMFQIGGAMMVGLVGVIATVLASN
jgi:hypothetical protein